MLRIHLILTVLMLILCPLKAEAIYLFDSGDPTTNSGGVLTNDSWFSANFTLTDKSKITGIESWFSPWDWRFGEYTIDSGDVYFSIYGHDGSSSIKHPDLTNSIFSKKYTHPLNTNTGAWYGVLGLNEFLDPGKYWIVLEVPIDSNFQGLVGLYPPKPFDDYARYNATNVYGTQGTWDDATGYSYAFRLEGEAFNSSAVPEPSTLILFGIGFTGVLLRSGARNNGRRL